MLGVYVTVPIACFRKGLAQEYLETESLPAAGHLLRLPVVAGSAKRIVARTLAAEWLRCCSVILRKVWCCALSGG